MKFIQPRPRLPNFDSFARDRERRARQVP